MARINTFEEIEAWREARRLVRLVYSVTREGRFAKDFGFRDQIQKATISVMSNIAEGFERGSNKELIQFLYIAKGSVGEVRSQLYAAMDLDYITKDTFDNISASTNTVSRKIAAFIKYLQNSGMKGSRCKAQQLKAESKNKSTVVVNPNFEL